jgi:hypothetical protein
MRGAPFGSTAGALEAGAGFDWVAFVFEEVVEFDGSFFEPLEEVAGLGVEVVVFAEDVEGFEFCEVAAVKDATAANQAIRT